MLTSQGDVVNKLGMVFFSLLLSVSVIANSVSPNGEFAEINVKTQNKVFKKLSKGRSSYIEKVIENPNDYNPAVLYALASSLFKAGRKDEAIFWFYAGQLRARSDVNKSLDKSAAQGVGVLNQTFGGQINQYAFTNISKLTETIEKVVNWDKKAPRNYDPRWIALHGLDAFLSEVVAFEPKEKWAEIDISTREEYLQNFRDAMKQIRPMESESLILRAKPSNQ
jgi:hypothetical protein